MSLKKKAAIGVAWQMSTNGFAQVTNFIIYILLARFISVEEFGLVAFSILLLDFVSIFMDIGINQNLIRRKRWSDSFSSSAHWFFIIISFSITLSSLVIVVPGVYLFYSKKAALLLASLSVVPLINGFRMTHNAKFQRDFQNKNLALIEFVSILIGGILSVFLAIKGLEAWSIVIGRILKALLATSITGIFSKFKPKFTLNKKDVKDLIKFGLPLFYMAFLSFFSKHTNKLLVGFFLGPSIFAFISVAKRAFEIAASISMQPLNKIMVPTISQINSEQIPNTYYRTLKLSSCFTVPIYFGLGAISEPFLKVFLGSKWEPSILLMSIFSFAVPALVIGYSLPTILVVKGETKDALKIKLISFFANTLLPLSTLYFGVEAMVCSVVLSGYLTLPLRFKIVSRYCEINLFEAMKHCFPFVISGLFMFISVKIIYDIKLFQEICQPLILFFSVCLGAGIYFLSMYFLFNKTYKTTINEIVMLRK